MYRKSNLRKAEHTSRIILNDLDALKTRGIRGSRVFIHRFNDQTTPAKLVACNCSDLYPGSSGHLHNGQLNLQDLTSVMLASPSVAQALSLSVIAPPAYPAAAAYGYPMVQASVQQMQSAAQLNTMYYPVSYVPISNPAQYPQNTYPMTAYGYATGLPYYQSNINVTNGTASAEPRSICLAELPYATTQANLDDFSRKKGCRPTYISIRRDQTSVKRSRGHATAQVSSQHETQHAIKVPDKQEIQGKEITACLDKETTTTAISQGGPLVVNGSGQTKSVSTVWFSRWN